MALKRNKVIILSIILFSILYRGIPAYAKSIFEIDASSDGATHSTGFNNVTDLINGLDEDSMQEYFPSWQKDVSAANITMNFRGIKINLGISEGNSKIALSIPEIDFSRDFSGASRQESLDDLKTGLKKTGEAPWACS